MTKPQWVALGIVLTLVWSTVSLAIESSVLFVLDGSGSMQAMLNGRPKIEHARTLLSQFIASLPPDKRIGLATFGHTRKNDCSDIEMLTPVGSARTAVIKAMESIHPKGMTPLTGAMQLAAAQFREYEGEAQVIVISDGKETCEGDPCAAVRKARAAGVKMQVHVVGFDVTPEETKQLRCIAEAGDGKYFAARNASELGKALAQVKKEVDPSPPSNQPKAPAQPKQINLLDLKNGGQVFIAPNDRWLETIDGKEDPAGLQHRFGNSGFRAYVFPPGAEAVFAFKDEQPATFNTFSVLIPDVGNNLKGFELLVADDSPTGPFRSIGTFQTVNAKFVAKKGYQDFKFPAVTAKYLKVKLLSGHEENKEGLFLYEFRLFGTLQE
jgi:hypothetical protein